MSRRRCDTTAPSRRTPGGRNQLTRPEYREACRLLGEIMRLVGQAPLADVCERALAGHGPEQIRATTAILQACKWLLPEMPKGSEP